VDKEGVAGAPNLLPVAGDGGVTGEADSCYANMGSTVGVGTEWAIVTTEGTLRKDVAGARRSPQVMAHGRKKEEAEMSYRQVIHAFAANRNLAL
jgi:hypothetical protein